MRMKFFKEYKFFIFSYVNILTALLLYIYIVLHCVQAIHDDVHTHYRWEIAAIAYVLYTLKGIRFLLILRYVTLIILIVSQPLLVTLIHWSWMSAQALPRPWFIILCSHDTYYNHLRHHVLSGWILSLSMWFPVLSLMSYYASVCMHKRRQMVVWFVCLIPG